MTTLSWCRVNLYFYTYRLGCWFESIFIQTCNAIQFVPPIKEYWGMKAYLSKLAMQFNLCHP